MNNRIVFFWSVIVIGLGATFLSCQNNNSPTVTKSGLSVESFEKVINESDSIRLFVLTNQHGSEVCITNYGGRIVSLMVPDREDTLQDVVLGFDNIDSYLEKPSSFGASIGRFANRIAYGKFVLDNDTIQLDINNGEHTIHGGSKGWQNQVFKANQSSDSTLLLTYHSPAGEGGFPGNVIATITYTLRSDQALQIEYSASTDKRTVINMTNHSFFNLSGDPNMPISDHELYVNATSFTPVDTTLITTGEILSVKSTPFDFTVQTTIGEKIDQYPDDFQLKATYGIDHNFVLNTARDVNQLAAKLYHKTTGIILNVYTNEPGLQVYTGNMLDGSRVGKKGVKYEKRAAVCLESQHFPDSPNKEHWPSTVLDPENTYKSICVYKFGIKK